MQLRTFLGASLTAMCTSTTATAVAEGASPPSSVYELRTYSLKRSKQPLLESYLIQAWLPTLHRFGFGPIGVFVEKGAEEPVKVYVLTVYPSAEEPVRLWTRLDTDKEYQQAAREYLAASASDPVYSRVESSLLLPIAGMPRLEKPDTSKARLLNLRIYESHNERAAKKKIEMFNQAELDIFRRVGLTPVFFGETVIGPAMPNLTYMLVFPDEASRDAAWARFRDDADWKKLRAIPEYADKEIVSRITNKILSPTAFSEI